MVLESRLDLDFPDSPEGWTSFHMFTIRLYLLFSGFLFISFTQYSKT